MNKTVGDLLIISNIKLNHDNYLLELESSEALGAILPGQFVNVLIPDAASTFLRRPFSIHDTDLSNRRFSILVKVVGEGTRKLVLTAPGQHLDVIFPLGNGFSRPTKGEKILLIGGGVGIAPMMHMARESKDLGAEVHILLGARTSSDHILIEEFKRFGKVYLTTNDGSMGVKGFVNHHPVFSDENSIDRIYCCGPELMMQAVAAKAAQFNIDCEVSLENMMACGFGVCLCCVTSTSKGNQCVCTEGPVFNTKQLKWPI